MEVEIPDGQLTRDRDKLTFAWQNSRTLLRNPEKALKRSVFFV